MYISGAMATLKALYRKINFAENIVLMTPILNSINILMVIFQWDQFDKSSLTYPIYLPKYVLTKQPKKKKQEKDSPTQNYCIEHFADFAKLKLPNEPAPWTGTGFAGSFGSSFFQFSSLYRKLYELTEKGYDPSRAENSSAGATARASSARAHQ